MAKQHRIPVKVIKKNEIGDLVPVVPTDEINEPEEEDKVIQGIKKRLKGKNPQDSSETESDEWRDRAMRLQAEMENYRKRQERLAEGRITRERERLLLKFLGVLDNLEQVLAHLDPQNQVYQGVNITHKAMVAVLKSEGVESIPAVGEPFDPYWHDAVTMVPATPDQEEEMVVIAEEVRGYRIGDRLLRPARVIVAKK